MLAVHGLSAAIGAAPVLEAVDLTLAAGERLGLVGASGSGKSTLARLIAGQPGAVRVTGGRIALAGRVALVPQNPADALDPLRSLRFHWLQAERAVGLAPDPGRAAAILGGLALDLDRLGGLSARPWAWSRGMQQRFVIGMALLGAPRLLILDEPTSALDPTVAAVTLTRTMAAARGAGAAVLMITHDLGLAARFVDRLAVLDAGRIVEVGATAQVLEAPRHPLARRLVAHRAWANLPC